jgi:hypothetical protein
VGGVSFLAASFRFLTARFRVGQQTAFAVSKFLLTVLPEFKPGR